MSSLYWEAVSLEWTISKSSVYVLEKNNYANTEVEAIYFLK